jgi:uncharacterized paraquat-inducible protein A
MWDDTELVLKVRESLARPVSARESRMKRSQLIMLALLSVVAFVCAHFYRISRGGRSWTDVTLVSLILGLPVVLDLRRLVREYGVARARPAFPVPEDVLEQEVRRSRLCPSCRALAQLSARRCPKCGNALQMALSPEGLRHALLVGAVTFLFLWYQTPGHGR